MRPARFARVPTEEKAVTIPRKPDDEYVAELARLRERHGTVDPDWSFEDVRTLLDVAGRMEPALADWVEEIALRIADRLARGA